MTRMKPGLKSGPPGDSVIPAKAGIHLPLVGQDPCDPDGAVTLYRGDLVSVTLSGVEGWKNSHLGTSYFDSAQHDDTWAADVHIRPFIHKPQSNDYDTLGNSDFTGQSPVGSTKCASCLLAFCA